MAAFTGQKTKTADSSSSDLIAPSQSTSDSKINTYIAKNNPIGSLPCAKDLHEHNVLQTVDHKNKRNISDIKALRERHEGETLFMKIKSPPIESVHDERPLQNYEQLKVNQLGENRIISPQKVTRQKTRTFNQTSEDIVSIRIKNCRENEIAAENTAFQNVNPLDDFNVPTKTNRRRKPLLKNSIGPSKPELSKYHYEQLSLQTGFSEYSQKIGKCEAIQQVGSAEREEAARPSRQLRLKPVLRLRVELD